MLCHRDRSIMVREDSSAASARHGFVDPPCAETRSWPFPSDAFACKTLLIGSELPRSLAPAARLLPIRAAPQAADSFAGKPSQVSGGRSRWRLQVPQLSPVARRLRWRGPIPAKGLQDLSTAVRFGVDSLPAIQSLCDRHSAPHLVWLPTPGSVPDCSPPWHRAAANPTPLEKLSWPRAADFLE